MSLPVPTAPVAPPGSTYVVKQGMGETLTARRETDALGALTRGLQEYLSTLTFDAYGGRKLKFRSVSDQWEDRDEPLQYPAAVILVQGSGSYAASSMSPTLNVNQKLPEPDGRYLVKVAEMQATLGVELYASDKDSRSGLIAMLEDAMVPEISSFSLKLGLPHYFGLISVFALIDISLEDSENDAAQGRRKAMVTVSASVPVVKLVGLPYAKPRVVLESVGTDVVVETTVT